MKEENFYETRDISGTYIVEAQGHGNDKIKMKIKLSKKRIEEIKMFSSHETKGIADSVFDIIPASIIKNQTLNVDTVSSATFSSKRNNCEC